jgi:hypothetical protein
MNDGGPIDQLMTTYFQTAFVVVAPSVASNTAVEATLPR